MSHFLFCLLFCLSSNLGTLKSDRHLFVTANMNSSDNFCCTVVVVGICFPIFCCIVMLMLQYVYSKPERQFPKCFWGGRFLWALFEFYFREERETECLNKAMLFVCCICASLAHRFSTTTNYGASFLFIAYIVLQEAKTKSKMYNHVFIHTIKLP